MNSYYVEYEDYTLYINKDIETISVSCVLNSEEDIVGSKLSALEEVITIKRRTIVQESNTPAYNSDDYYGPQRICKLCQCSMILKWDAANDENAWLHPETDDCYFSGRYVHKMDTSANIITRDHITIETIQENLENLHGAGANWYSENKKILDALYIDHADNAGASELELRSSSFEDEDGNKIDVLENSDKGLADADSEIYDLTEYTAEEISFINYLVGGDKKGSMLRVKANGDKEYSKGCRGMLLRSHDKPLKKLKESHIRKDLYDYYLCILTFVAERGYFVPATERWICKVNNRPIRTNYAPKPIKTFGLDDEPKLMTVSKKTKRRRLSYDVTVRFELAERMQEYGVNQYGDNCY